MRTCCEHGANLTNEPRKPIDWSAIEADYLDGRKTIRQIARWYQISDAAIRKHARVNGWERPEAVVAENKPELSVQATFMAGVDASKPENIISRGQNLVFRLLAELEAASESGAAIAELIEMEEDNPRRRAALMAAVSLKGRADVVKALATAFKTWTESQTVSAPDGKKAQRQAAAEEKVAGGGKFAPGAPPKLVVSNK